MKLDSDQTTLWTEQRDEAMNRVLTNAERVDPDFRDKAKAFVLDYLRNHVSASSEEITNACKQAEIVPHDDRAFGPIYFSLAKQGLIEKCGMCLRTKGHGTTGGNIWRLSQ